MFQSVLILLGVAVILYVGHLLLKAYLNKSSRWDGFQAATRPAPNPVPADAPTVERTNSEDPPRVVASAGPNPPNAQAPEQTVEPRRAQLPEPVKASDPYDEMNSETPIRDNLRHPENSFGPGVENMGTRVGVESGVASPVANSQFSPEFAQNGGEFMRGILANDSFGGDNFATI